MNVVLLVVDSLRAGALDQGFPGRPRTPFLDGLSSRTTTFRRAYATECWTLPSHASMFTGLWPSQHAAHFRTMGYVGRAPTVAELLAARGFHTEVVTRNSIFDGALPGITRGFQKNTPILADVTGINPLAIVLALSKPRFRRQINQSGFFHPLQRESRRFVTTFARSTVPADGLALEYVLEQMARRRRAGTPYFFFCNLYDVHAPYPPSPRSIFRSFRSLEGCLENLRVPFVLPSLGSHTYLRPGFHLSRASRAMLLRRYHTAIELMDEKLARFHTEARSLGLLDDTLLVVTSDHGEGFGEHGLYLHDSSVYETHLHVPLWVHHPDVAPAVVDDVVSTRDLFELMQAAAAGDDLDGTLLDPGHRARHPIAIAEHFHYPHARQMAPEFRQDLVAAVTARWKLVIRREGALRYDLAGDPAETEPVRTTIGRFVAACRGDGLDTRAIEGMEAHLRAWQRPDEPPVRSLTLLRGAEA
jgi:hypothetical protein